MGIYDNDDGMTGGVDGGETRRKQRDRQSGETGKEIGSWRTERTDCSNQERIDQATEA